MITEKDIQDVEAKRAALIKRLRAFANGESLTLEITRVDALALLMAVEQTMPDTTAADAHRRRNREAMHRKRRAQQGLPIDAPPYTSLRGEGAPAAKLTRDAVRAYRARWAKGKGESINSLAREAGVSASTMHAALHGRTWQEVENAA